MAYRITDNPDGSITVHDYAVQATLAKGEKGLDAPADEEWLDATITSHKQNKRSVFLFDGHNEVDDKGNVTRYAPIVGRAEPDSLYRNGNVAYVSEMKVADPRFVQLFKRDLVGNQSSEFLFKTRRILGVALIGGIPGHQDAKLPEPRPMAMADDYKAELKALAETDNLREAALPAQEKTMAFTDEQRAELKTLIAESIKDAIKDATKQGEPALSMFSNDFDSKLKATIDERDRKRDIEECRKRHILALSARDKALWSESALTEHFKKCETVREIESEFKRLTLLNSKTEATLALQEDEDLQSGEYQLRKEAREIFARRKDEAEFKKLYADEASFVHAHVEANKVIA